MSPTEASNVDGVLRESDLVIDATADAKVLNHLSGVCINSGSDLVWGGVYSGGIGGYMARSQKNRDPCPLSHVKHFKSIMKPLTWFLLFLSKDMMECSKMNF